MECSNFSGWGLGFPLFYGFLLFIKLLFDFSIPFFFLILVISKYFKYCFIAFNTLIFSLQLESNPWIYSKDRECLIIFTRDDNFDENLDTRNPMASGNGMRTPLIVLSDPRKLDPEPHMTHSLRTWAWLQTLLESGPLASRWAPVPGDYILYASEEMMKCSWEGKE